MASYPFTKAISPSFVAQSRKAIGYFVHFIPEAVWAIEELTVVEGSVFAINCVFTGASDVAQPSGYSPNQQQVYVYRRGSNVSASILSDAGTPGYTLSPGNVMITASFQNLVGGNTYVVVVETAIDGDADIQRRKFQINVLKDETTP